MHICFCRFFIILKFSIFFAESELASPSSSPAVSRTNLKVVTMPQVRGMIVHQTVLLCAGKTLLVFKIFKMRFFLDIQYLAKHFYPVSKHLTEKLLQSKNQLGPRYEGQLQGSPPGPHGHVSGPLVKVDMGHCIYRGYDLFDPPFCYRTLHHQRMHYSRITEIALLNNFQTES